MSDFLEDFIEENSLTMHNVRKLVDDYSLFSYYIGAELDVQTKYSSPLREGDEDPSFSLFYGYGESCKDKLYFKDQARQLHGDVYDFLKALFNTQDTHRVLEQIDKDLGLGLGTGEGANLSPTILKGAPVVKERPKLNIVSQKPSKAYKEYWWSKYEITKPYLDLYNANDVSAIHYQYSHKTQIVIPRNLCIAYTIGKYNKTYQPFETKEYKFRNDYPSNYIEGHMQIDWSRNDSLVISKAFKEDILFRQHWNIQAVSGKSETTEIQEMFINQYLNHFKNVYLWLDPDEAGIKSMKKYMEKYPKLKPVWVPDWVKEKDPTDFFEVHRKEETTKYINQMLKI